MRPEVWSGSAEQLIQCLGSLGGQLSVGEQPQGVIGCLPTPNPSRIQEGWEGGSDALWEEGCLLFEDLWSLRNKNKYNLVFS